MFLKKKTPSSKFPPIISQADKAYFIVTCHGWSASNWTAVALSKHPHILCCHSAMNIPANSNSLRETEVEFKETMIKRHNARLSRGSRSIDALFDEVAAYDVERKRSIYGNVHSLRIRDLPRLKQEFPTPRPHVLMNQIRHPVSVVESGFGQVKNMLSWDVYVHLDATHGMEDHLPFFIDLADRYQINLCDYDVRSFCYAANHLLFLGRDCRIAPDAPTIVMERITTEREYFAKILQELSAGRIEPSSEYLDEVYKLGQLNRHKSGKKITPQQQYESWLPWQQEVFYYFFIAADLKAAYQKHGYDFSFIKRP